MNSIAALLDTAREKIRSLGYSARTEQAYLDWIKRYLAFYDQKDPRQMGSAEVIKFLSYLAVEKDMAAASQNQAKAALLYLYREVIEGDNAWMDSIEPAATPKRLPIVLTPAEIDEILNKLHPSFALQGRLVYGTGMRLLETVRLRVRDINFEKNQIVVRDDEGAQSRVTLLPRTLVDALKDQINEVRSQQQQDMAIGLGEVDVPASILEASPKAGRELEWQFLFPSSKLSTDAASGDKQRLHVDEKGLQRAMKRAVKRVNQKKAATPHTLRHSFAVHLLNLGIDVEKIQDLLGHSDVATTMMYLQITKRPKNFIPSPLDLLRS